MKIKDFLGEGVLLVVIALSIMDLLQYANGEIRLFKELLSWVLIGYFIYHLSPTNLFFKNKHKRIDLLILVALYFFVYKDFDYLVGKEEFMYIGFIQPLLIKYQFLNEIMFSVGAVLILLLSIYLGARFEFKKSSILGIFRHHKKQSRYHDKLINIIVIYAILVGFSYFIFTILMEWFVLVLDSYFVCIALVYYFIYFYFIKSKRGFRTFLNSVVSTGSNFLLKFLNLFHNKKTILFGISGIIVIHAVVDIGNFIVPYVFNVSNLYLETLSKTTHMSTQLIFMDDISSASTFLDKIVVAFIYIQNIIAICSLLFLPFYIWIKMLYKKQPTFHRLYIAIFFSSLISLFFAPIFKVTALKDQTIVGVDILTKSLQGVPNISYIALFSVLGIIIIYALTSIESMKKRLGELAIVTSLIFLGMYIYFFYTSTFMYYISSLEYLFSNSKFLLAFYFLIYLITTTLFYIGGFILFIFEVKCAEGICYANLSPRFQKNIFMLWSLGLFAAVLYFINADKITDLMIVLITSVILSLVVMRFEKDQARFILMINLVLASFLTIMLSIPIFIQNIGALELVGRVLFIILLLVIMVLFKYKFNFRINSYKKATLALILGLIFGYWFYYINEPTTNLLYHNFGYILLFSFVIAFSEELMFRYLILKSAAKVYSVHTSIVLQAIFFGLLHLISFKVFFGLLGGAGLSTLFFSLIIFGVVMGELTKEGDDFNPIYAVIAHTVAVAFMLII